MFRRAIGSSLVGLCALTGPLSTGAVAIDSEPGLTLDGVSAAGIRPGVAFGLTPDEGCPSDLGAQQVSLTFVDRADNEHSLGSVDTADDGTWSSASVRLPVAGLGAEGWTRSPVARGPGLITATCSVATGSGADPDEDEDPGDGEDPTDPGGDGAEDPNADDPTDPGEEDGDPDEDPDDEDPDDEDPDDEDEDEDEDDNDNDNEESDEEEPVVTLSYQPTALTVSGVAAKLVLSQPTAVPGGSIKVTPGERCAAKGVSTVTVSLVALGEPAEGADPVNLPTATATTSSTGVWPPLTLPLPAGTLTGDYAVAADCAAGDVVSSSYAAQPLALGTVRIGAASCSSKDARVSVTGTYSGRISLGKNNSQTLPATVVMRGNGPWTVKVRSEVTGQTLAAAKVDCKTQQFELAVVKTGISKDGKVRAQVCNSGRSSVTAVLQVFRNKRFQKVDQEKLAAGECSWLEGAKVKPGQTARARVWVDAPGSDHDEVAKSFRLKRHRG